MEELKISTTVYFEIKDSEIFGGEGTIGYSAMSFSSTVTNDKPDIFKYSTYEHIKRLISYMAEKSCVSEDKIRTISKDEYDENTDDD